jgi:predicted MPP superfamily phosphohydrolase
LVLQIKKGNVKFLFNNSIVVKGIQITGLDFMQPDKKSRRMHFVHTRTIKEIMPTIKLNKNLPQVLFHHSPVGEKYIEKVGIDLMVSGHTHGGQIFPVTLLANLLYRVNKGFGSYKKMKTYVSQGVGTFGPPMRLGTHGEITLIKIIP